MTFTYPDAVNAAADELCPDVVVRGTHQPCANCVDRAFAAVAAAAPHIERAVRERGSTVSAGRMLREAPRPLHGVRPDRWCVVTGLDAIRRRVEAATDGWVCGWEGQSYVVRDRDGSVVVTQTFPLALGEDWTSPDFRNDCDTADAEFIAHARTDTPRLLAALDAVERLCAEARPSLSLQPVDCTDNCGDGPCDCSGAWRVSAWSLDPDAVRAVIADALKDGETP